MRKPWRNSCFIDHDHLHSFSKGFSTSTKAPVSPHGKSKGKMRGDPTGNRCWRIQWEFDGDSLPGWWFNNGGLMGFHRVIIMGYIIL